jgi:AraC-like DNA-binding protein
MELAQILLRLAEQMPADAQTASQPEIQPDAADLDIRRMAVLDHLINSCFTSDFSDSEVAQHLYLSERQLSRIVQKWYGNTLRRIIIEKRIVTAAQLLQKTNTPTDQIGYLVGFQSKSVFSREFQKLYGVTPAVYRKNCV